MDDVHSSCTIYITEYTAENEAVILHCGHLFHPHCINKAVQMIRDARCVEYYCDIVMVVMVLMYLQFIFRIGICIYDYVNYNCGGIKNLLYVS